MKNGPTKFVD